MKEGDAGAFDAVADRQAAEWFGRREVGLTPAEEREFHAWLAADPRHKRLYRQFDEAWNRLDRLKESPRRMGGFPPAVMLWRRRPKAIAAIAAAAGLAVGLFLQARLSPDPRYPSYTCAAEPGGMKTLELPDGSVVRLNSDSAVAVRFDARIRRVVLRRGEAFFTVAKDPARPFVVDADRFAVRAVGTEFDVSLRGASLAVLVTEGKVNVAETAKERSPQLGPVAGAPAHILAAGEKAIVALGTSDPHPPPIAVAAVGRAEEEQALAWRIRTLEFDQQPLSAVVAEFNRFNRHQLVIADRELASRRFGGTFQADNYEALVELLERRFGVAAERQGDRTILRPRR